nr:hypothetical protein CFP56_39727 [Quercus suber]POF08611.1 hypothetical protein CFP56_39730 [Quercus suber]
MPVMSKEQASQTSNLQGGAHDPSDDKRQKIYLIKHVEINTSRLLLELQGQHNSFNFANTKSEHGNTWLQYVTAWRGTPTTARWRRRMHEQNYTPMVVERGQ